MTTSSPPRSRTMAAKARCTCPWSATSARNVPAMPGCCARTVSHTAGSRSRTATSEPSSRIRAAVAAPMPLAPPVITTRLPLSPRIGPRLPRLISARQDNKRRPPVAGPSRGEYLLHFCARHMAQQAQSLRTRLYDNPEGRFVHDVILDSCRQHGAKIAMVDTSCTPARRISYAAYGELVERAARGLVAAGVRPGEMIGIYLPNCWEFGVAYHAATLAGAVPTTMNPTYREREVRYQLETADAVALISDGALLTGIDLSGLPALKKVYTIRNPGPSGSQMWDSLFAPNPTVRLSKPEDDSPEALASLPFSSGPTGLPKGVMLSHFNLVANVFQTLTPGEFGAITGPDVLLCFLPLYHIYGLTVGLNLPLMRGCTLVLMPRFDPERSLETIVQESVTITLCVPPTLLAYCQAAEQGK